LLEYNADTPTILVEAAVGQQLWLSQIAKLDNPNSWQLNEIHRRLVAAWPKVLRAKQGGQQQVSCLGFFDLLQLIFEIGYCLFSF
jgi:glutathionylspermidine synthase